MRTFLLFPQTYFSQYSHMYFSSSILNSLLFPNYPVLSPTSHLLFALLLQFLYITYSFLSSACGHSLMVSRGKKPFLCSPQYLHPYTVVLITAYNDPLVYFFFFLGRQKCTCWRSFVLHVSISGPSTNSVTY